VSATRSTPQRPIVRLIGPAECSKAACLWDPNVNLPQAIDTFEDRNELAEFEGIWKEKVKRHRGLLVGRI
jgi:hypothetical protein